MLFLDPFAMPASGVVVVQECDSSPRRRPRSVSAKITVLLSLTAISGGCVTASAKSARTDHFTATNLVAPPGATLAQACTPTGPELCFNAVDDNCNGVIDEGCGLQTGLLQFVVAWGNSPADVNLVVVTPQGERVPDGRRSTASGFHLDRDCPADEGCSGQNVENIYFDGAEPPRGRYTIEIALADLHGAEPPVKVSFGARLGPRTIGFDVDLAPGDDAKRTFSFDLP